MTSPPLGRNRDGRAVRATVVGTVLGAVLGGVYAMSGWTPLLDGRLPLGTGLILIACPILGAVSGYAVAAIAGRHVNQRQDRDGD